MSVLNFTFPFRYICCAICNFFINLFTFIMSIWGVKVFKTVVFWTKYPVWTYAVMKYWRSQWGILFHLTDCVQYRTLYLVTYLLPLGILVFLNIRKCCFLKKLTNSCRHNSDKYLWSVLYIAYYYRDIWCVISKTVFKDLFIFIAIVSGFKYLRSKSPEITWFFFFFFDKIVRFSRYSFE